MEMTLKERLKRTIKRSHRDVFLRDDFLKLGCTYRQLSRVLSELQSEKVVVRAGYGLYMRPTVQVEKGIEQVQRRLGRRVRRVVTVGGIVVQLGMSTGTPNQQDVLDRKKLAMARLIAEKFKLSDIRQTSLGNIERWQTNGVWVSAFEEWRQLLTNGTDQQLLAVLTGQDENSNRLRQSAPYAGLLTQVEVETV